MAVDPIAVGTSVGHSAYTGPYDIAEAAPPGVFQRGLLVDPRDYAQPGDANDTDAWERAVAVAAPLDSNRAARGLLIPPGISLLSRRVTLGKTGGRYNGPGFIGLGKELSIIKWAGAATDGPLRILNGHNARVSHVSVGEDSGVRAAFGVWFSVEDTRSGFNPRTDNLHVHAATLGLVIGGGTDAHRTDPVTATGNGQANAGLHTGYYASGVDEAVRMLGSNVECQTFIGYNFFTLTPDARFARCYDARGLTLFGGEVDFEASTGTPVVIEALGGNLYGAAFLVKGLRVEEGVGLFWADASRAATYNSGSGASLTFSAEDVLNAFDRARTDPTDMVRMGYQGTVSLRNVTWTYPRSRVRWIGLSNGRIGTTELRNCEINNVDAAADPNALVKLDTAGALGPAAGGLLSVVEGCLLVGTDPGIAPSGRIPNQVSHRTQTDVQGTNISETPFEVVADGANRGVRLGKGSALVTKVLRAAAAHDFPSINAGSYATFTIALPGAVMGDEVTVSRNLYTAGLLLRADVSAADVVTVTAHNANGAAVDPLNSTYTVSIVRKV